MPKLSFTAMQPAVLNQDVSFKAATFAPVEARSIVEPLPPKVADVQVQPLGPQINTGVIAAEHLRVINPGIWGRIGGCLPPLTPGLQRAQLDCPIAPSADISDSMVFEGAVDQNSYHLPRYRLARHTIDNVEQYLIRIEQMAGNWVLRASLQKFRAPEIPAAVQTTELAHELLLRLIFSSAVAGGGAITKELPFQDIKQDEQSGLVVATLQFSSPAERDQALAAITTATGAAGIKVSRAVKVAVSNNLPNPLYNVLTRGVDMIAEPNPLFLNLALNKYFFDGETPPPKKVGFTPFQVQWGDRFHTYWQDAGRLDQFYYLPDEFRLGRRAQAPFYPTAAIKVTGAGANADTAQMSFEFVAVPWVDSARLADARRQLAKRGVASDGAATAQPTTGDVLGGLLGSVIGGEKGGKVGSALGNVVGNVIDGSIDGPKLRFEPMLADKVSLWLALPGINGAAMGLVERPGAQIDTRAALVDAEVFSLAQFQSIWQALFGGSISLLRGEVRLDLGGGKTEAVPVSIRLDQTVGDLLTAATAPGEAPGTLQLTLTNQTESPVLLRQLHATLSRNKASKAATIDGKLFSPAMEILPGTSAAFTLTPEDGPLPGGGPVRASVSFDAGSGKGDPEAVWNSLLDPSTPAEFARNISVEAFASMFDAPASAPNDKAQVILLEFENGSTVQLTPAALQAQAIVRTPLAKYILQKDGTASYRYRCKVIRTASRQSDKEWRTDSTDILFPELPGM